MSDYEVVRDAATVLERMATIEFLETLAQDKEKYAMAYAAELLRGVASNLRRGEHRR